MLVLVCSCATKPLYYWGSYPNAIYAFTNESKEDPKSYIPKLENDIAEAKNRSRKGVPPGLYAHLGVLYVESGDSTKAAEYFNKEAELFPDSQKLMNRFLGKRVKK